MSTTIAVLTLACIIVIFMTIKKVFKNKEFLPLDEEEDFVSDNVTPYRPPTVPKLKLKLKISNS